jgi:hypothetical protein
MWFCMITSGLGFLVHVLLFSPMFCMMVYVAMDDDEGILVWLGGWGFGNINLDGHPRTLCG